MQGIWAGYYRHTWYFRCCICILYWRTTYIFCLFSVSLWSVNILKISVLKVSYRFSWIFYKSEQKKEKRVKLRTEPKDMDVGCNENEQKHVPKIINILLEQKLLSEIISSMLMLQTITSNEKSYRSHCFCA